MENGLPPYVSKHPKTKIYRYFRRPPKGVVGKAFSRSFGTKDRKVVWQKYAAIHAEAEKYFDRLISGRTMTDQQIDVLAAALLRPIRATPRAIESRLDLNAFIDTHGSDEVRALTGPDRVKLEDAVEFLYRHSERVNLVGLEMPADEQRDYVKARFGAVAAPIPANAFTLKHAFDLAWKPAANRSPGTVKETERFVNDFVSLNGNLDLRDYTRDHWAKWHAHCLELHGPGGTALKRFSMVKTVVAEAIRVGRFERKNHAGQDVTMRKPGRTRLRNEGWSDDELKDLFESEAFNHIEGKQGDARYWVPVIIALTGARLSEVSEMQVADVGKRHGVLTFYLAREQGKTEESRRIIPVPQKLIDLGLLRYVATLPQKGRLFPTVTAKTFTKYFGRYRKTIGINRRGCDLHAMRHHIRTLLRNVGTPDDVADHITGHTGDGAVGSTYGKTELQTALGYLNKVDLGVNIPKWKGSR